MIRLGLLGLGAAVVLAGAVSTAPEFTSEKYESPHQSFVAEAKKALSETDEQLPEATDNRPVVEHVPMPEAVKAIYMSSCVVGTPSFREELVTLVEETEVNSLVIDIKDFSGSISFPPKGEAWQYAWESAECGARDMKEFIATLHEKDIYVIGRVTVFQDPLYTTLRPDLAVKRADGVSVWKDYKGLSFIDVGAQEYWDHLLLLVKESYNVGFDEINFDYVRYPSDGPMKDISFPNSMAGEHGADKQANLEAFFAYLHEEVGKAERYRAVKHTNTGRTQETPYTSADLFGMTTTNYDDLSIGQLQERALPYFDAIAPMVYPSHYPGSFLGLGNPNLYPYKVVHYAMKSGVDRAMATTTTLAGFLHEPITTTNASGTVVSTGLYEKPTFTGDHFRTWIQDFDYGGDYDAADVRAQIQASYDAGVDSWMIWAPSNRYTRGALLDA